MHFELRPWQEDDIENIVKNANNILIAKNLTNQFPYPYTKQTGEKFIQMARSHSPTRVFAIDINGMACGGIGLHPQEDIFLKNAELGYWLAIAYWGQGIMTRAIREIVSYGFAQFEIERIFARPFGSNIGSQRVLEKAGFIQEARLEKTIYKMGQFEDELIYSIRRSNFHPSF